MIAHFQMISHVFITERSTRLDQSAHVSCAKLLRQRLSAVSVPHARWFCFIKHSVCIQWQQPTSTFILIANVAFIHVPDVVKYSFFNELTIKIKMIDKKSFFISFNHI